MLHSSFGFWGSVVYYINDIHIPVLFPVALVSSLVACLYFNFNLCAVLVLLIICVMRTMPHPEIF